MIRLTIPILLCVALGARATAQAGATLLSHMLASADRVVLARAIHTDDGVRRRVAFRVVENLRGACPDRFELDEAGGRGCGFALSGMIFFRAFRGVGEASSRRRDGPRAARSMTAVVLGVCAVGLLAFMQLGSTEKVHRIPLPTDRDFDLREGNDRRIGVLGGKFHFSVQAESLLGSADADQILAVLYDYCCPHCRHTHALLRRALEKGGNKFAVLALPLPMNRECNPHAPEEMPERFKDSCELVRIALAVRFGAPERFAEFDSWLYELENPREPQEARRQADRILDGRLEAALSDARVERTLKRNIDAFSASGADRVPVIFGPWVEPIVGRVEEEQTLARILDDIPRGAAKARK